MKKLILHISLLLLFSFAFNQLFAQDEDYSRKIEKPGKVKDEKKNKSSADDGQSKFIIGGGIGLQFGTQTFIELSPKLGYRIIPKVIVGGGILYRYYHYEDPLTHLIYQGSDYGGSVFTSYELIRNLFGWAELELINFDYYDYKANMNSRITVASPFVGVGYRQQMGEKGFFQLAFLYNLNYTSNSPYGSPLVTRIGFFF